MYHVVYFHYEFCFSSFAILRIIHFFRDCCQLIISFSSSFNQPSSIPWGGDCSSVGTCGLYAILPLLHLCPRSSYAAHLSTFSSDPCWPAEPFLVAPPQPSHVMVKWGKAGIFNPRYLVDLAFSAFVSALVASSEPCGLKSALKSSHWVHAMQEEMDGLCSN